MKSVIVSRSLGSSRFLMSGAAAAPALRTYRALTWTIALMAGVGLAGGCLADNPTGPDPQDPDEWPGSDAMPAPDAPDDMGCIEECLSETSLRQCAGGERVVECSLGCVAEEARCGALVPSNGAGAEHLLGVTAALTVAEDAQVVIDTSVGSITVGGESVRGAGVGVNNGIGFQYTADGLSVFTVQGFTMGARANLRARGGQPFLILSAGDVEIAGTIDASAGCDSESSARTCGGPGGGRGAENDDSATGCGSGADPEGFSPFYFAGGGGGGFGLAGAAGGSLPGNGIYGGGGGVACEASLVPLRGGSGGGQSALSFNEARGQGGGGGGAVQITSYTAIRLVAPAIIDAGGSGGSGNGSGGGGGGSGGGILLEAPSVSIDGAVLVANGGGGGGVPGNGPIEHGEDGRRDALQARGGFGAGLGGALAGPPTAGGWIIERGGGGGGGAGLIHVHTPMANYSLTNTVTSPAPVRLDPEAE